MKLINSPDIKPLSDVQILPDDIEILENIENKFDKLVKKLIENQRVYRKMENTMKSQNF